MHGVHVPPGARTLVSKSANVQNAGAKEAVLLAIFLAASIACPTPPIVECCVGSKHRNTASLVDTRHVRRTTLPHA